MGCGTKRLDEAFPITVIKRKNLRLHCVGSGSAEVIYIPHCRPKSDPSTSHRVLYRSVGGKYCSLSHILLLSIVNYHRLKGKAVLYHVVKD